MKGMLVVFFILLSTAPQVKSADSAFTDGEVIRYLKPENSKTTENIINAGLEVAANRYISGENKSSGIVSNPMNVSKLTGDFEANEIVATEKYKGVTLRIKGIAKSIGIDFKGDGKIIIGGGGGYSSDMIGMVDKNAKWIKKIVKGNNVDVICKIDGMFALRVSAHCWDTKEVLIEQLRDKWGVNHCDELPKTLSQADSCEQIKYNESGLSKFCANKFDECYKAVAEMKIKKVPRVNGYRLWVEKNIKE